MLNKNDPLIGAVQQVMQQSNAEREATRLVNEAFGVEDRKALPHEYQAEWNSVYQQVLAEGVEALDEDWDSKKRNKAEKIEAGAKKIRSNRQGHIKDFGKMIANRTRQDAVTGDDTAGRASKAMKDLYGKNKGDRAAIKKISEEEALDEAKIDHPNKRKLDVAEPYGELTSDDFRKLRAMKEEEQIDEKAPPGREDQVKTLKKKVGTEKAYKFAWASYKKNKKLEEGFNDRHSLSENASAEKQTVAALNEEDIDSYEKRVTAGLGGGGIHSPFLPYGGGRGTKAGLGAKIRIDPSARNINTRTGQKIKQTDIPRKKRTFVKRKPTEAKPPEGTMAARVKNLQQSPEALKAGPGKIGSQTVTAPRPNLAAGAARRPVGTSNVPQIRQTVPSSGSNLPQGPWGGIRRGGASPRPTGLAAGAARRPAGQSAPPMRQQGTTLPPPKSRGLLRRGGSALAAGAALDLATSSTPVGNQPPAALAGVGSPGNKALKPADSAAKAPAKVTDTDIMNDPRYKAAVKNVGGEKGARKIGIGKTVDPVGKFSKGETIWSKVKSQLEKERTQAAAPKPAPSAETEIKNFAGPPSGTVASKPDAKAQGFQLPPRNAVNSGPGQGGSVSIPAPAKLDPNSRLAKGNVKQ